jgi:hypothetical protein
MEVVLGAIEEARREECDARRGFDEARRREGRYLLLTSLTDDDPEKPWQFDIPLLFVEEAFKILEGGLASFRGFRQNEERS